MSTACERVRVGDVLRLERRPVAIDLYLEYNEIGVRSFGRGIFHKEPIDGASLGSKRVFTIEPGDLVISNVFAWEGAIALATEAERGRIGSHRFMTFVGVDERIHVPWAAWYFKSEQGLAQLQKASPGSAGRNKTLAIKRFEDLVIELPPPKRQAAVAARLSRIAAAADLASSTERRGTALASAFAAACASRPDLPDAEKVDKGWERAVLGDVMVRASNTVTVDTASTYPNLGIYSFGRGVFRKPDIAGEQTSAKTLFRVSAGQFIYSRLFAFEGAYAYVPDDLDGFFVSSEFPSFDADPTRLDARWLANYLRTPDRWTTLAMSSTGLGVRRQRVPVEAVLAFPVHLPPIDTQHQMVHSIERVELAHAARVTVEQRFASLVPAALNQEFMRAT